MLNRECYKILKPYNMAIIRVVNNELDFVLFSFFSFFHFSIYFILDLDKGYNVMLCVIVTQGTKYNECIIPVIVSVHSHIT